MKPLKKIQTTADVKNTKQTPLKLIKGGLFPLTQREKRVSQLWLFCHATLWNNQLFSDAEVIEFKELIDEHFKGSRNLEKTFKQLIERVCLAKRYVSRKKGRYISKPVDWLNINYKNGLKGTEKWFKQVQLQRADVPHYNEGISILSLAVLQYCEVKSVLNIEYYREKFISLKQFDLLQYYMNTVVHLQYCKLDRSTRL